FDIGDGDGPGAQPAADLWAGEAGGIRGERAEISAFAADRDFPDAAGDGVVCVYLSQESISDFAAYKSALLGGFAAVGIASCIFVQDFLAVRGLAVVFLVLAKLMVDTARWNPSEWRLVVVTWAYVLVIAGIWFT